MCIYGSKHQHKTHRDIALFNCGGFVILVLQDAVPYACDVVVVEGQCQEVSYLGSNLRRTDLSDLQRQEISLLEKVGELLTHRRGRR